MRSSQLAVGVGLLALIAAVGSISLVPAEHPSQAESTVQAPAQQVPGTAAMRVRLDPETGALSREHQPVGKADAALEEALSRSDAGIVAVQHPDGSVSAHLQGRFQSASMARIDADGKLHTTCVDSHAAAQGFCKGEHTSTPVLEEK